jgi:hypothetical protein
MHCIRMLTTATVWLGLLNPAFALGDCATPDEAMALKSTMLQQQLMVAGLACHETVSYRDFLQFHGGELQGSDMVLKAFFERREGRQGDAAYDAYRISATKLAALNQSWNGAAFCAAAAQLFEFSLKGQTSLDAVVAAAPSMPGLAIACRNDSDPRKTARLARATPLELTPH